MLLTSFSFVSLHICDFPWVSTIPNKNANLSLLPMEWPTIVTTTDGAESPTTAGIGLRSKVESKYRLKTTPACSPKYSRVSELNLATWAKNLQVNFFERSQQVNKPAWRERYMARLISLHGLVPRSLGDWDAILKMHFSMMTSNGNIFRVTGPLCGEFTGHRGITLTKTSDAGLWCFLWFAPEQAVEQTIDTPVIWDAIALIMTLL